MIADGKKNIMIRMGLNMKYIIDEEELHDLLLAYFRNEAIINGRTDKDTIFDDFENYLNHKNISLEGHTFDEAFDALINEEIKNFKVFREIDSDSLYGFDYTEKVCK